MKDKHCLEKFQCPYCMQNDLSVYFYQCCSRPSCEKCHNTHPSIICKLNQDKENIRIQDQRQNRQCSRCLGQQRQVYCSECRCSYCAKCSRQVHCREKFLYHNLQIGKGEQLVCLKHYCYKNMMSQCGKLKCEICVSETKDKKVKIISEVRIQLIQSLLQSTEAYIINWKQNELQRYHQLKQNLERQYFLLKQRIQQKINLIFSSVQSIHLKSKQSADELLKKISNMKKQLQIYTPERLINNKIKQFLELRSFFINQEVNNIRKDSQRLDYYQYKFSGPTNDQIEGIVKSYVIQKIKIKNGEDDEKENKSLKKSRMSSGKLSYRHQRKSQSKSTTKNTDRSINTKISAIGRVNHDYIKPTILPFTNITNCQDKLKKQETFTNSQTSLTNCQASFSSLVDSFISKDKEEIPLVQDRPKPNYLKRKTDYLDMRDRMRKPSVINRFQKR